MYKFEVIEKKTGKVPDITQIALTEKWASNLVYCDLEGFFISQNGSLVLADECGNFTYCPIDRFEIRFMKMESE